MSLPLRARRCASYAWTAFVVGLAGCAANGSPGDPDGRRGSDAGPRVDASATDAGEAADSEPAAEPDTGAGGSSDAGAPSAGDEACDGVDDDGDGAIDEGCPCDGDEAERECYSGPDGTAGVGVCAAGAQRCEGATELGGRWGECVDEALPGEETCGDGTDEDCDGEVDEGCDPPPMPEACTEMTFTHVVGSASCADDEAVFMMDDGEGPNFICCPLPATDILTGDAPVVRGSQCNDGELITGAVSRYNFECSAIDTDRYQLGPPQLPCYFGDGAAGGFGVDGCAEHPHTLTVLAERYFGSDGCSGQPYGALFVAQRGDDCEDLAARQLQYTGSVAGDPAAGTPVPMFPE